MVLTKGICFAIVCNMKRIIQPELTPHDLAEQATDRFIRTGKGIEDVFADLKPIEGSSPLDSQGRPLGSFDSMIDTLNDVAKSGANITAVPGAINEADETLSYKTTTPESMKFTPLQKMLAIGVGALALTTAGYFANKQLNEDPSVTYPGNSRNGVETIEQNKSLNSIHDNAPADTVIHVNPNK